MLDKLFLDNYDNYENYDNFDDYIDLISSLKGISFEYLSVNYSMNDQNLNENPADRYILDKLNPNEQANCETISQDIGLNYGANLVIIFSPKGKSNDIKDSVSVREKEQVNYKYFKFNFNSNSNIKIENSRFQCIQKNNQKFDNIKLDTDYLTELELDKEPMIIKFKDFPWKRTIRQKDLKEWAKITIPNYEIYLKIKEIPWPDQAFVKENLEMIQREEKKARSQKNASVKNDFRMGKQSKIDTIDSDTNFPQASKISVKAGSHRALKTNPISK